MFKYKNIVIIILSTILFSSCDDWLIVEPSSGVTRDDFWQSKEDINSAVIGCYTSMQKHTVESMFLWSELRGDMLVAGDNCPDNYRYILEGDIKSNNKLVKWGAFYSAINYCNTVIEFAPSVLEKDASLSQEQLDAYLAEAYAIRGLMYFYLVRSFGDVPLVLRSSSTDDQDFSVSKVSRAMVLNQIKTDLLIAEKTALLSYSDNASSKGRITKYAVKAILADVYLWLQEPDQCLRVCDDIINSGQYGLIEGDALWFSELYGQGNSVESIFEIQFDVEMKNPFYGMLHQDKGRKLIASSKVYDDLFVVDENADLDSLDIRGDNASYKSSRNSIVWKYMGFDARTGREEYESYANYMIYRYADVLLLKAEALTYLDRGGEALSLIYDIRKRAKASAISDEKPQSNDIEGILRFLLNERARELAFEGKRWYDVLRVAKYNNYAYLDIMLDMVKEAARPDKQQSMVSKHRDVDFHYFPIHIDEINVNPNLEQNEYYIEGN